MASRSPRKRLPPYGVLWRSGRVGPLEGLPSAAQSFLAWGRYRGLARARQRRKRARRRPWGDRSRLKGLTLPGSVRWEALQRASRQKPSRPRARPLARLWVSQAWRRATCESGGGRPGAGSLDWRFNRASPLPREHLEWAAESRGGSSLARTAPGAARARRRTMDGVLGEGAGEGRGPAGRAAAAECEGLASSREAGPGRAAAAASKEPAPLSSGERGRRPRPWRPSRCVRAGLGFSGSGTLVVQARPSALPRVAPDRAEAPRPAPNTTAPINAGRCPRHVP